ncbi:NAD-dependent DNA ligase LigA [Pararhodonellum marinum]|uniref:NAD-dependent DNA ligase LigA n=1 Tax=Pararhodonellum marinum TaxID=2755358 RepID=UPI00188FE4AC|nr:NAD-dependent DNA ligase LigA [Pararhodonellum marinum]
MNSKTEAQKRIAELTEQINYHNQLYYQEDTSEISDFEFDQLLNELIQLETEYPDLLRPESPSQRVGGTITKVFETAEHEQRMLSLGNTYSESELIAFDERVAKGLGHRDYTYFCELKFDGVAISLVYENGRLIRAVTRGDGFKGDVVTENVKTIRNIPLYIKGEEIPERFEARGEIFLPKKEFDKINAEREKSGDPLLANPRNAASGTLKMQDSSVVAKRRLNCYFYQLIGDENLVSRHDQAIHQLEKWGFNVSQTYKNCTDIQSVLSFIESWREKRHHLPLDTDGVVLKVNDYQQREILGFTAKIPRWAIAYKYKAESALSTIRNITFQVGRTGAITPVANLSPVQLAGTTVKRASLHNANEILRLDLHEGDQVFVEKGGEIIPKITGVSLENRKPNAKPFSYITHCPECHTHLNRKEGEAKHYCPNAMGCPPQLLGRIEHFVHKRAMDIDSLGTERIRALINQGYVKDPADIYDLESKQDKLLGLEINDDQYTKDQNGSLYVTLRKALFALTEGISLSAIDRFLEDTEGLEQQERLQAFKNYLKKFQTKSDVNLAYIARFEDWLQKATWDTIEDYVPVAPVLLVWIKDLEVEQLVKLCKEKNSVHNIVLEFDFTLTEQQTEKLKKLKGNTFQEGVISNMMEGIKTSKNQPFEKVLFALGIRNIGENTAKLLAEQFGSIDALAASSIEELLEINGVGETLAQSLQDFFSDPKNQELISRLKGHGLHFKKEKKESQQESQKLTGLKILASGKLNHFKRDEIIDFVESHGGTYLKSVSKNLDFIIEGEDMGPSKKEKAQKLGIKMIDEQAFLNLLNHHG